MERQHEAEAKTRPGFARRTEDFPDLISFAESYEADPDLTKDALYRAISLGLAGALSDKEHRFLCTAVSMLNRRALECGKPHCYLGGWFFCQALGGISPSTLSRIKRSLEAKGLIIRHYDKRNRPLEKAGIDLRPLLLRLEDLQEHAEALFEASRGRFEEAQALDDHCYDSNNDTAPGQHCHPNSPSPNLYSYTVQTDKAESPPTATISNISQDRLNDDPNREPQKAALQTQPPSILKNCSPMEISDFWQHREQLGKGLSSKARSELLEAHRLSPTLSNYLDAADIEAGDIKRVYEACLEVIKVHFNPQRNGSETFKWAVKKFNWRAVQILISALEDPTVKSPEKWFGWAVTKMRPDLDLSNNFRRIRNFLEAPELGDTDGEDDQRPPVHSEPPESGIAGDDDAGRKLSEAESQTDPQTELMARAKCTMVETKLAKPADIDTWFAEITVTDVTHNIVILSAPSRFLANWIKENYSEKLAQTFSAILNRPVTPHVAVTLKKIY